MGVMEETGSFAYTRETLARLRKDLGDMLRALGGNERLDVIIKYLESQMGTDAPTINTTTASSVSAPLPADIPVSPPVLSVCRSPISDDDLKKVEEATNVMRHPPGVASNCGDTGSSSSSTSSSSSNSDAEE